MEITGSERNDQLIALGALKEDCDDLAEGGILDFCQDAEQAETARVAYAESLAYMKKTTENVCFEALYITYNDSIPAESGTIQPHESL